MNIWDEKNKEYLKSDASGESTEFARFAEPYFSKKSRILDLGAGAGHDSRYFVSKGHKVVSTDFSEPALQANRSKKLKGISVEYLDLGKPFPFPDESFDTVYASVSIQYFDDITTDRIFADIKRVLKKKGVVALLLNSRKDPEHGKGNMLEEDYFEVRPGLKKRFFDEKSIKLKIAGIFNTIILDDMGSRVNSRGGAEGGLIRYIGVKV
ncbi:class I SAM-dependent methyltransferase [Patescibacteria group bacterium]|nr:class I SAM-dependent methyltransferase [Patescibacteria group bacterium]